MLVLQSSVQLSPGKFVFDLGIGHCSLHYSLQFVLYYLFV